MPRAFVHQWIGGVAGAVAASWCSREQKPGNGLWETVGGLAGGVWGASVPDLLDPPRHSGHRGLGHGIVPAVATTAFVWPRIHSMQVFLREMAGSVGRQGTFEGDPVQRIQSVLLETFLRITAGAVPGIVAGCASHWLLDLETPRGLPFLD